MVPALGALLFACSLTPALAQEGGRTIYQSSGFELAFSYPLLDYKGSTDGGVIRFAPVVQAQHVFNFDLGEHLGAFAGVSVNNVGFIYQDPDGVTTYKFRSYDLGLPLGIKLGTMNAGLLFGGYSVEWPINYREKTFQYGDKVERFNAWFGERVVNPQQAVMLGLQTRHGICLKVKYYLTNFHDQDFTETEAGTTYAPYAGFNAHVLHVALGFALFQDHHTAYGL
ncbi:MAG: hypothetical protein JNL05_01765 [Flavobacteriales bacterium]|nr:hypothetical protein [Flavobacteriales bacterium]